MKGDMFTAAQKYPHRPAPAEPAAVLPPGPSVRRCVHCGAPAHFGFGVDSKRGIAGTWTCGPHRGLEVPGR